MIVIVSTTVTGRGSPCMIGCIVVRALRADDAPGARGVSRLRRQATILDQNTGALTSAGREIGRPGPLDTRPAGSFWRRPTHVHKAERPDLWEAGARNLVGRVSTRIDHSSPYHY